MAIGCVTDAGVVGMASGRGTSDLTVVSVLWGVHVFSISRREAASASVAVSFQAFFIVIQSMAYWHQ